MAAQLTEADLRQFTGTSQWYRWSILFRNCVLTDGTRYLAEQAGAYWLMDAIASHQPKALKNANLRDFQVWTLTVKDKTGVLECREDSDTKPIITQMIPYTDFTLEKIELWCNPMDETVRCILLPSEH
jgi:hypothetical protein